MPLHHRPDPKQRTCPAFLRPLLQGLSHTLFLVVVGVAMLGVMIAGQYVHLSLTSTAMIMMGIVLYIALVKDHGPNEQ